MQVTNVRVVYGRKRQPAQYESSTAEIEFIATVADDADHIEAAKALLADAKTLVLTELGIVKAGESASAHSLNGAVHSNGAANGAVHSNGAGQTGQTGQTGSAPAAQPQGETKEFKDVADLASAPKRTRKAKETPQTSSTGSEPAAPAAAPAAIPEETKQPESALGRTVPASAPGAPAAKPNGGAGGIPLDDTAASSPATAAAQQGNPAAAVGSGDEITASVVQKYITHCLVQKKVLPPVVLHLLKTTYGKDRVQDLDAVALKGFYNEMRSKAGDQPVA